MRFLGLDPGLAATGYGIIDADGSRFRLRSSGVITTDGAMEHGERLRTIYDSLLTILDENAIIDRGGIESLFFFRNRSSALPVAEAKGVLQLALTQRGIICREFTPLEIKSGVTGIGRAEKKQVQKMVQLLLNLDSAPKPDHVGDALAVALCCQNYFSKQWRFSDSY